MKTRLYTQARYDEELEEWTNNSNRLTDNTQLRRPVSQPHRRRPISEYAMKVIQRSDEEAVNIRGENILMHELDMPLRTTTDYKNPKISASLQAVLAEALQTDDDVDITGQVCRCCNIIVFAIELLENLTTQLYDIYADKSADNAITLRQDTQSKRTGTNSK